MKSNRKVILYIAMSLDGYIAKPNDDLEFLSIVQKEGEDYGYLNFVDSVDTVIMGRKTYNWVMKQVPEFPHPDKISYIITRTSRPAEGKINFYTGNLKELIGKLKSEPGKHIFIDGGAELANHLLNQKLIDELIISIIPILVGAGTPLFQKNLLEQKLKLLNAKHYETGLVQVHYSINQ